MASIYFSTCYSTQFLTLVFTMLVYFVEEYLICIYLPEQHHNQLLTKLGKCRTLTFVVTLLLFLLLLLLTSKAINWHVGCLVLFSSYLLFCLVLSSSYLLFLSCCISPLQIFAQCRNRNLIQCIKWGGGGDVRLNSPKRCPCQQGLKVHLKKTWVRCEKNTTTFLDAVEIYKSAVIST